MVSSADLAPIHQSLVIGGRDGCTERQRLGCTAKELLPVDGERIAHTCECIFLPESSPSERILIFRTPVQMLQDALFHETIYDALRSVVERAGGAKAVGTKLRPSKAPDEAGRWVLDCLNTSRAERFAPDDVMHLLRIGREIGYHGAMAYIADDAGYRCEPVEPQDEQAKLMREFNESTKALARIAERIERIAPAAAKPRAVA